MDSEAVTILPACRWRIVRLLAIVDVVDVLDVRTTETKSRAGSAKFVT